MVRRCLFLCFMIGLSACQTASFHAEQTHQLHHKSDLWQQISSELKIDSDCARPAVKKQIAWYLRHKSMIRKIAKRAKPYLYYIHREIRERHLPTQLILLPAIESAYDPIAYSGVGAAGLWQFMPGTASGFGIKQNWWYDGRRDLIASTRAALEYLTYLNEFFDGDWLLTIAAYDAGEGTVAQAIRRNAKHNRPVDYWSLHLPGETQDYIPRMLALACVIKHTDAHQLNLPPVNNAPYLVVVQVGSQIDLAEAAKLAGISLQQLYHLNPGFNRWATDPSGPFRLILPIEKAEQFKEALSNRPKSQRVSWQRHHIKNGDTLGHIAHHYQTNVAMIKKINHLTSDQIRIGKTLLIPHNTQQVNRSLFQHQQHYFDTNKAHPGPKRVNHIVKKHEQLNDIAKLYGLKPRNIRFWNKLDSHHSVHEKQNLVLWIPTHRHHTIPHQHLVKQGESLWLIAKKYHTSVAKLVKRNKLKRPLIKPGQHLFV